MADPAVVVATSVHQSGGTDVAFSPDARWVATAGFNRVLRVIATVGGRIRWEKTLDSVALLLCWSPDGASLANVNEDGTVCLFDARTGEVRRNRLSRHATPLRPDLTTPTARTSTHLPGHVRRFRPEDQVQQRAPRGAGCRSCHWRRRGLGPGSRHCGGNFLKEEHPCRGDPCGPAIRPLTPRAPPRSRPAAKQCVTVG
jgi:hypothetical protein